jgi:hypothetical protein
LRSYELEVIGNVLAECPCIAHWGNFSVHCQCKKCGKRHAVERCCVLKHVALCYRQVKIISCDRISVQEIISAVVKELVEPRCDGALDLCFAARVEVFRLAGVAFPRHSLD